MLRLGEFGDDDTAADRRQPRDFDVGMAVAVFTVRGPYWLCTYGVSVFSRDNTAMEVGLHALPRNRLQHIRELRPSVGGSSLRLGRVRGCGFFEGGSPMILQDF